MIDYTKAIPFVFVLAPIQDARQATFSGMASPAICTLSAATRSSLGSEIPHALDDLVCSDDATSTTNQDSTTSHTSHSFSCCVVELFIILIGQIGFLAHQFLRISDIVDVLSSSFVTLEQTTNLEITNLCATMGLVKQGVDSVKDQICCHSQIMALQAREFAALIANQQRQIDDLGKQLYDERELERDIKKTLDNLTFCVPQDNRELDVFHECLHDQLACQIKDQTQMQRDVVDLRKELDIFYERLHGQLISQVEDQIRTENDVANFRKDIPKTLSLYHTRISALEFASSQVKLPPSPQVVICDSRPVQSATFVDASPLPKRALSDFQHLATPTSAPSKKQRSDFSISARSLRLVDRQSIYIQPSASVSSKTAGIPMKSTTPKTPTTVDSVRRPFTIKFSVSKVLPSSMIPTPGTRVSSAPKGVPLKNPPSKDLSCDNGASRESVTPKSGSATRGKAWKPRVFTLNKSDSAVKDNAKAPIPLKKKSSRAAKGKAQELSNNQVLPPSSCLVTPATTLRALDSTFRPDDASHGIASQPLSSSQSLEALDVAVQLHSLGDLYDPLPSLDSMSWLDVALGSVASQLLVSSSLEALDAAVECHSLGDLHDSLPSLDSMSWLDECHEFSGQPLPSSSTEALDAAVQLSSQDKLCGMMPSLDLMSLLDNDALAAPPFKNLGRNKARNNNCHRESLCPSSSTKALDAAMQLSSPDDRLCETMLPLNSMSFLDDDTLMVPSFKCRSRP